MTKRRLESVNLCVDVLEHPKILKLAKRLGDGAVMSLLRLWIWVGKYRPEGALDDCTGEDIETIAKWESQEGRFVDTLLELRLLDTDDVGRYKIHDWSEHNKTLFQAQERSDIARKAAQARWNRPQEAPKPALAPPPSTPTQMEDFGLKIYYRENVTLTERQHKNLLTRFGEDKTQSIYDYLSQYKKHAPPNHKRYPSDYQSILSWVAQEVQSEGQKQQPTPSLSL